MVCDGIWTDFDNDGWQDLVLCGEWMPVTFLKNTKGAFTNITSLSGIQNQTGWFTSLAPADVDNDGDIDYIAGNAGLNSFYRATERYPVSIYGKDFNGDGNYDAITTLFLPASQENPVKKEYPAHVRDDMTKQIIGFKSKYQNYKSYATATFSEMFSADEMKNTINLQVNYFSKSLIKSLGKVKFTIVQLPMEAQF